MDDPLSQTDLLDLQCGDALLQSRDNELGLDFNDAFQELVVLTPTEN